MVYFMLPQRGRWAWLLGASCYFYMYFIPMFILVLAFSILIDYAAGLLMENDPARKKFWLVISLAANCSVLFVFKYVDFLDSGFGELTRFLGWNLSLPLLKLMLPIGLSFHTFQAMAYTIEVYRGHQPAERHLGIYALYVMFFPQLVAGPIERPQNLLPQFRKNLLFEPAKVVSGLRLILWGTFKKVVIADRLSEFVDHAYGNPTVQPPLSLILATALFAFQIYYDFSGYTDIARGSARVMGFELMENFNMPYFSTSMTEFWRRWNISLSTWFRDYVYVPLGGSQRGLRKTIRNLFIVFLLSGIWHGAKMTFVIWGFLHFIYVATEKYYFTKHLSRPALTSPLARGLRILRTFILSMIAWVFFRADSVTSALQILEQFLFVHTLGQRETFFAIRNFTGLMPTLALLTLTLSGEFIWQQSGTEHFLSLPKSVRWSVYYLLIISIFSFGVFNKTPFIYFQF